MLPYDLERALQTPEDCRRVMERALSERELGKLSQHTNKLCIKGSWKKSVRI